LKDNDEYNFEMNYPKRGDKLLDSAPQPGEKRLFSGWMKGQWLWYPDAYKQAADKLVDQIEGHPWEDRLIFPVIFLYRHFVELKLKYLIIELDRLSGTRIEDRQFNRHQLIPLWSYVKDHLNCIREASWDNEILSSLESLIRDFDRLDSDSYHFRYSHDTKFQQNPLPDSISLEHFKQALARMEGGFGYIEGGIDMEVEGRNLGADFNAYYSLERFASAEVSGLTSLTFADLD
jgi:hypothetical protein